MFLAATTPRAKAAADQALALRWFSANCFSAARASRRGSWRVNTLGTPGPRKMSLSVARSRRLPRSPNAHMTCRHMDVDGLAVDIFAEIAADDRRIGAQAALITCLGRCGRAKTRESRRCHWSRRLRLPAVHGTYRQLAWLHIDDCRWFPTNPSQTVRTGKKKGSACSRLSPWQRRRVVIRREEAFADAG